MKNRSPRTLLIAIPIISLTACSAPEGKLPESVVMALSTAITAGDIEGCAALFTDDGEVFYGSANVATGKAGIRGFCQDQQAREISVALDPQYTVFSGNVGGSNSNYRVRDVKRGLDVEAGRSVAIWKQVGGRWKMVRLMIEITEGAKANMSVEPAT